MANYKNLFLRFMDREEVRYTEMDDHVVKVVYTGENLKTIPIFVFFDENGEPLISVKCWEITNFKDDKMAGGMIACNMLNKQYRWVKFFLDDDSDVVAQIDAYVDEPTCGSECLSLVRRMVNIIDEAYPTFMRALWS